MTGLNQSLKYGNLLFIEYVKRRGLDLSKEISWVSQGQRPAKLQAVKVGDLKKIVPLGWSQTTRGPGSSPGQWDHLQSLTDHNFTAL